VVLLIENEFYWDSPPIKLQVEDQSAEIENLFILSPPKVPLHKLITAEATIHSYKPGKKYKIAFWQNSPSGYEKIGESNTDTFQSNEEKSYTIEFFQQVNLVFMRYTLIFMKMINY
jgi:hypothetical protein